MAESGGLLNRYTSKIVSGVRIPLSPPFLNFFPCALVETVQPLRFLRKNPPTRISQKAVVSIAAVYRGPRFTRRWRVRLDAVIV